MIEILNAELKKVRLEFYKALCIKVVDKVKRSSFGNPNIIDKKALFLGLEGFLQDNDISDVFEDLKAFLEKYFKTNKYLDIREKHFEYRVSAIENVYFKYYLGRSASENKDLVRRLCFLKKLINFLNKDSKDLFLEFENLVTYMNSVSMSDDEKAELFRKIIDLDNERIISKDYNLPYNKEVISKKFGRGIVSFPLRICLDSLDALEIFMQESKSLVKYKKRINRINEKHPYDTTFDENHIIAIHTCLTLQVLSYSRFDDPLSYFFERLGCPEMYGIMVAKELKEKEIRNQMHVRAIDDFLAKSAKVKREEQSATKVAEVQKEEEQISSKMRKKFIRELDLVYDFDNNECLRVLSMDEIIECLAKLILIKSDDDVIKKFLFTAEKTLRQNPYTAYQEMLDKMECTITNPAAKTYLDDLKGLVKNEFCFITSKEEYKRVKDKAAMFVRNINKYMEDDYNYEHQKALVKVDELKNGKSPKSM